MKEDLLQLMEEYSLTLRRVGDTESHSYVLPKNASQEEIENSYECIFREMDEDSFKRAREKGYFTNCEYRNGFVIGKMVRKIVKRDAGWLVKIDGSHCSIQQWSRKTDFFGITPEEAITKAVQYARKRNEERVEKLKKAGINID